MVEFDEAKGTLLHDKKQVHCPICQGKEFWTRRTLMNTAGVTFFGLDWANRSATNYVCISCGYVQWFLPDAKPSKKK